MVSGVVRWSSGGVVCLNFITLLRKLLGMLFDIEYRGCYARARN